jgi:quercetin 2,3-dioxygenase
VWIHQNAWFHLGDLDKDFETAYTMKADTNGLYIFVLNGSITVNSQELNSRDGFGIWNTQSVKLKATSNAEVLLMEVPMKM